jgi:hypothetical protein
MASEILKYLKSHPDAADSLEGIMNWWQSDGDRSREEVEIALNSLVIQHILERVENQQRQVIYRAVLRDNTIQGNRACAGECSIIRF